MGLFDTTDHTIRFLAADAVEQANSGHPGTPMALAGITTELFANHLRYNPKDPAWPNRDRFVLSCGHASMLLYSVLHLAGYDLSKEELVRFRQLGSKTPGHPEYGHTPGVETTTGPLGQGVGNAVGMALASKMLGARVGEDIYDFRVFAVASDGDLMEGVASEASSLAAHLGLDNLVLIYDDNKITIDGNTEISFSEDVPARYRAYGFEVFEVDGHDREAVARALTKVTENGQAGKPKLIVAKTHIGIGAPTKQDTSKAHGSPLGRDEINAAKQAVGWPIDEFVVPEDAKTLFKQRVEAVQFEYDAWQTKVRALPADRAQKYRDCAEARVPKDLFERLLAASKAKKDATRSSGGKILQKVAELVPAFVGGSADLAGSTKTDITGGGYVAGGDYGGRNFHFGVREHAMGAICNGLALSGLIPVGATFLIFSDYMRPTLRLAAMMKQRVVIVYTHDSIYVGEDGPTHQPVEQLSSLRLIPNLHVWRPADSAECAVAWASAVSREDGPSTIALTRQGIPPLDRAADLDPKAMLRGAYVLSDASDPDLILIATGSEVHVAVEAKALLEGKGHRVRVVSAPCLDLFVALPKSEQEAVLGHGVKRVSLEAAATGLWRGIVGLDGICIGLDDFGASGPAGELQEHFGFTAVAVAARIQAEA